MLRPTRPPPCLPATYIPLEIRADQDVRDVSEHALLIAKFRPSEPPRVLTLTA